MIAFLSLLLAAASSQAVDYQRLEGNRIRVSIVFGGDSFEAHTRAQLRLIAAARRLCGGPAVSAGTLQLDRVPKDDPARRRGSLRLSEEYSCVGAAPAP